MIILKRKLRCYELSEGIMEQRYSVKQEMHKTYRALLELELQLEEVVECAEQWEAPE